MSLIDREYVDCDFCGKNDTDLVFEVYSEITMVREKFSIVRCRNCGLVYINPRPLKQIISKYYPEDNYYSYKCFKDLKKSFLKRIKEIAIEYIGNYPKISREKGLIKLLGKLIAFIVKKGISVIIPYKENAIVLDIGCGSGELLFFLKKHGFHVYGVGTSGKAANYGNKYGLNILNCDFTDTNFPSDFFDIIVINQVLEHLYSPYKTLKEINRIIKKGGLLILGVPNIDSYGMKVCKSYSGILDIPRHLYHFSISTLKKMLLKSGFKIEKIVSKTFFIPYYNKYSLSLLKKECAFFRLFKAYLQIYLLKPIFFTFSRSKESFGEFITIYAYKGKC